MDNSQKTTINRYENLNLKLRNVQQANFVQVEPIEPQEPGITTSTGGPYVWYDTGGTIVAESPQFSTLDDLERDLPRSVIGRPSLWLRLESWLRRLRGWVKSWARAGR